jgi:hypothetical protein
MTEQRRRHKPEDVSADHGQKRELGGVTTLGET